MVGVAVAGKIEVFRKLVLWIQKEADVTWVEGECSSSSVSWKVPSLLGGDVGTSPNSAILNGKSQFSSTRPDWLRIDGANYCLKMHRNTVGPFVRDKKHMALKPGGT